MFSLRKLTQGALMAGFAAIALASGSASAQQMKIGNGASLNLEGKVNSQVALALGSVASAHNVVGGITSGGGLSLGNKASITTRATSNSQVALALGSGASAGNNVAGVLAMGSLTSR